MNRKFYFISECYITYREFHIVEQIIVWCSRFKIDITIQEINRLDEDIAIDIDLTLLGKTIILV